MASTQDDVIREMIELVSEKGAGSSSESRVISPEKADEIASRDSHFPQDVLTRSAVAIGAGVSRNFLGPAQVVAELIAKFGAPGASAASSALRGLEGELRRETSTPLGRSLAVAAEIGTSPLANPFSVGPLGKFLSSSEKTGLLGRAFKGGASGLLGGLSTSLAEGESRAETAVGGGIFGAAFGVAATPMLARILGGINTELKEKAKSLFGKPSSSVGIGTAVSAPIMLAPAIKEGRESTLYKLSKKLKDEFGVRFSPALSTGSEGQLSQVKGAIIMLGEDNPLEKFRREQFGVLLEKFDELTGRFHSTEHPQAIGKLGSIGAELKDTVGKIISSSRQVRSAQWKEDLEPARKLVGNKPFLVPNNLFDTMVSEAESLMAPGSGPIHRRAGEALMKEAKNLPDKLNLDALKNRLAEYTDQLVDFNIEDPELHRKIRGVLAPRLKAALLKDMEEAEKSSELGKAAAFLKQARQNWAANSRVLELMNETQLTSLLKVSDVDKIGKRLVSMGPNRLRQVADILEEKMPDQLVRLKGLILENALESAFPKGQAGARLVGGRAEHFDARKFIAAIPDNDTLKALKFSQDEIENINKLSQAFQILQGPETFESRTKLFSILNTLSLFGIPGQFLLAASGAKAISRALIKLSFDPAGDAVLDALIGARNVSADEVGFVAGRLFSSLIREITIDAEGRNPQTVQDLTSALSSPGFDATGSDVGSEVRPRREIAPIIQ